LHSKVPRFIDASLDSANCLRNWTQLLKNGKNQNLDARKHYASTLQKPTFARLRSHTQKNKGSTGKLIQRDRNEASKIRMASVMYGEDYELEL